MTVGIIQRFFNSIGANGYTATYGETSGTRKAARSRRSATLRRGQLIEAMEPRVMLTTLTAGSSVFVDAAGKRFTVTLRGNITAELFASDGNQLIDLVDVATFSQT